MGCVEKKRKKKLDVQEDFHFREQPLSIFLSQQFTSMLSSVFNIRLLHISSSIV